VLKCLGVENPMALYDESQPDVTPTMIGNVKTQKYSQKKGDKTETKKNYSSYDANTEAKIKAVMAKNNASRETVIAALKKAGKLK
jgi:NACalpha-BTF3-like transcription factor